MAKFRNISAMISVDAANNENQGFNMADYYGNQIVSANAIKEIKEKEEEEEDDDTIYGDYAHRS